MEGRISEPGVAWIFEVAQRITTRQGSVDKLDKGNVWEGDLTVDGKQKSRESLTLASIVNFLFTSKGAFRRYQMLGVAVIARYNELALCGEVPGVSLRAGNEVGLAMSSSNPRQTLCGREE